VRARIWGCRGSLPTPGPGTVRYGGNTSCVEVELDDGARLVLDAGTGICPLGAELRRRQDRHIRLLLTHLHLDHVEGLRFFEPLWDARVEVEVWGPRSPLSSLRDRIARAFSPPLFPIDLSDVPARVRFHDAPLEPWRIGSATISAAAVVHPGPTVGYRIEHRGRVLAYLPDHEPALAGTIHERSLDWLSGGSLAARADLLFHDAQFSAEEYDTRIGWGHSSVDDAVSYGSSVGAKRLVLFHHDPSHDDDRLDQEAEQVNAIRNGDGEAPTLAHEGMTVELS
jgi:phosphoribosyl 1,2-cyclic phosphodiesterase